MRIINYFKPGVFIAFENYEYDYKNLIERRTSYIEKVDIIISNPLYIFIFILSIFIWFFYSLILFFFSSFFYIYYILHIFFCIKNKKNVTMNYSKFCSKPIITLHRTIYQAFVSQSAFNGFYLAYQTFKSYKSKKTYYKILLTIFKNKAIGISYWSLCCVWEIFILFIYTINKTINSSKKNKIYIFYRNFLSRWMYVMDIVYCERRCFCREAVIDVSNMKFNPKNFVNDFIKYKTKCLSHSSISKIKHLALSDNYSWRSSMVLTTHPLNGQEAIGIYGSKKNSQLVINNISDNDQYDDEVEKYRIIQQNSGLDSEKMQAQYINEATLVRELSPTMVSKTQGFHNNQIVIKEPMLFNEFQLEEAKKNNNDQAILYWSKQIEAKKLLSNNDLEYMKTAAIELKSNSMERCGRVFKSIQNFENYNLEKSEHNKSLSSKKSLIIKTKSLNNSYISIKEIKETNLNNAEIINTSDLNQSPIITNPYVNLDGTTKSPFKDFTE